MDAGDGVFVSKVTTEDWVEDPDLPGSEMHELVKRDGVWAGMTRIRSTDGPMPWTPEQRETVRGPNRPLRPWARSHPSPT